MAAHKLAARARENLVKTRDARDADCLDVRATLLDAHERGVRPSEHVLRHVKACGTCRVQRRAISRPPIACAPTIWAQRQSRTGGLMAGRAGYGRIAGVVWDA